MHIIEFLLLFNNSSGFCCNTVIYIFLTEKLHLCMCAGAHSMSIFVGTNMPHCMWMEVTGRPSRVGYLPSMFSQAGSLCDKRLHPLSCLVGPQTYIVLHLVLSFLSLPSPWHDGTSVQQNALSLPLFSLFLSLSQRETVSLWVVLAAPSVSITLVSNSTEIHQSLPPKYSD